MIRAGFRATEKWYDLLRMCTVEAATAVNKLPDPVIEQLYDDAMVCQSTTITLTDVYEYLPKENAAT